MAGLLGDFLVFDTMSLVWTDLLGQARGVVPAARCGHGLTSVDGKLYIFGGYGGGSQRSAFKILSCSTIKIRFLIYFEFKCPVHIANSATDLFAFSLFQIQRSEAVRHGDYDMD
jgi:hypothetical protein